MVYGWEHTSLLGPNFHGKYFIIKTVESFNIIPISEVMFPIFHLHRIKKIRDPEGQIYVFNSKVFKI